MKIREGDGGGDFMSVSGGSRARQIITSVGRPLTFALIIGDGENSDATVFFVGVDELLLLLPAAAGGGAAAPAAAAAAGMVLFSAAASLLLAGDGGGASRFARRASSSRRKGERSSRAATSGLTPPSSPSRSPTDRVMVRGSRRLASTSGSTCSTDGGKPCRTDDCCSVGTTSPYRQRTVSSTVSLRHTTTAAAAATTGRAILRRRVWRLLLLLLLMAK
uniref:Uncharacterized protein n=1 Tax=Anopheles merus TaxID=30066 RepID=A0A182UV82_ANOME